MTITTARRWIRNACRNAIDLTTLTNADVDRALQTIGQRFCRATKCVRSSYLADAGLAADIYLAQFTLSSTLGSYFRPEHTEAVLISDNDALQDAEYRALEIINYPDLAAKHKDSATGTPTHCAWKDGNTLALWPISSGDFDLTVRFWSPFTVWTPGAMGAYSSSTSYAVGDIVSSAGNLYEALQAHSNQAVSEAAYWLALGAGTVENPNSTSLNIPDDLLPQILPWGPTAILQYTDPEMLYASRAWQEYEKVERSLTGAGHHGAKSVTRVRDD